MNNLYFTMTEVQITKYMYVQLIATIIYNLTCTIADHNYVIAKANFFCKFGFIDIMRFKLITSVTNVLFDISSGLRLLNIHKEGN